MATDDYLLKDLGELTCMLLVGLNGLFFLINPLKATLYKGFTLSQIAFIIFILFSHCLAAITKTPCRNILFPLFRFRTRHGVPVLIPITIYMYIQTFCCPLWLLLIHIRSLLLCSAIYAWFYLNSKCDLTLMEQAQQVFFLYFSDYNKIFLSAFSISADIYVPLARIPRLFKYHTIAKFFEVTDR